MLENNLIQCHMMVIWVIHILPADTKLQNTDPQEKISPQTESAHNDMHHDTKKYLHMIWMQVKASKINNSNQT